MAELGLSQPLAHSVLAQIRESGLSFSAPFSEPILLVKRARVAGAPRFMAEQDKCPPLAPGKQLDLRREADNAHDPWSIRVQLPDGTLLGYLPADSNEILSRLMDAGKRLYATVIEVDSDAMRDQLYVEVHLDD